MAISVLRRRALSLSSSLLTHHNPLSSSVPATLLAPRQLSHSSSQNPNKVDFFLNFPFQFRLFRSTNISLSPRPRNAYNNDEDKISPDDILFEGCDYNHWLITMDFPKDPKPSPEEMVETYVQTAAKVLGSVEEAKKKIYACSTTTYEGFQVEVSEEVSEKFKGLPGVIFVLPDSYLDPVNKEYGGDKYINGTIIPRPPPVQYGRTGGRYGDRNRDFDRPNRSRVPYQQGNSTYHNQGPVQGDTRNFRAPQPQQNYGPPSAGPPQQNYGPPNTRPLQQNYGPPSGGPPQQNYGPPRVGERRDPMLMNYSPGRENFQGDRRDPVPSYQGNYHQGLRGNSYSEGQGDFPLVEKKNYGPPQGGGFGQVAGGNHGQGTGWNHGQGIGGNLGQGTVGNYGQGAGQGVGGSYGQGVSGGVPGQEIVSNRQNYSGYGENQRFPQGEHMNNMQQGQQRNYGATGESGTEYGRY